MSKYKDPFINATEAGMPLKGQKTISPKKQNPSEYTLLRESLLAEEARRQLLEYWEYTRNITYSSFALPNLTVPIFSRKKAP